MRCLFLGYNRKKTKLIKMLETKGYKVSNITRKISLSDIKNNDLYIRSAIHTLYIYDI